MKNIFILVFLLTTTLLYSQETGYTKGVNWQVINGNVFLEWFLDQGETCFGIDVKRRNDTLVDYEVIHHVEGLCGSQDKVTRYTYTDTTAKPNEFNYYLIDLGGQSQKTTKGIWVYDYDEVLIFPQPPVDENVEVRFDNHNQLNATLEIYNLSGQKIKSFTTQESFFILEKDLFSKGTYLFQIVNDDNTIRGRILF